jgi:peptidoglycan biosynthesis protein MviN/MurJ (putative lipid II flippase)
MRRTRLLLALSTAVTALLVGAPSAFATTHNGVGIVGETDDKQVSLAMFAVMAFFVIVIVVFSLLQAWLEHRKHARMEAAQHQESAVEWKGGW